MQYAYNRLMYVKVIVRHSNILGDTVYIGLHVLATKITTTIGFTVRMALVLCPPEIADVGLIACRSLLLCLLANKRR